MLTDKSICTIEHAIFTGLELSMGLLIIIIIILMCIEFIANTTLPLQFNGCQVLVFAGTGD